MPIMLHADAVTMPKDLQSWEHTFAIEVRQEFRPLRVSRDVLYEWTNDAWISSPSVPKDTDDSVTDTVIRELKGVVTRVAATTVDVRLENSVLARFPVRAFSDRSLLKYGQPVSYQVRSAPDGMRYQKFVSRVDDTPSTKKEAILHVLDSIQV